MILGLLWGLEAEVLPKQGSPGLLPGQETRSHVLQLKDLTKKTEDPHATTETRHSSI